MTDVGEKDVAMDVPVVVAVTDADTAERAASRRRRFRQSLHDVASRSTSDDLLRWMLVPASILVILGFNFMLFGWIGASGTFRQIEQIPYLISGGLVGLALVFLGGLLLASTFWVVVTKKMQAESEERTRQLVAALETRLNEKQNGRARVKRPAS
ncbi:MAG: hypothetical protein QOC92_32 [Acidimicrobiaceae bacterium]|jgi:hypothetical protein